MRGAPLGLRGHAWVSWPITLQEWAENNLFTGHVYFYRTVTLVSPPRLADVRLGSVKASISPAASQACILRAACPLGAPRRNRMPWRSNACPLTPSPCIFHKWRRTLARRSRRAQRGDTPRAQSAAHSRLRARVGCPSGRSWLGNSYRFPVWVKITRRLRP